MKSNIWKKEESWIIIILIVSIMIYSLFLFANPVTMWDENVYLGNARSHIGTSNFTEDFRFPLLEYVIASIWFIVGESLIVARIIMILFSLASILAFYLITKEFFKKSLLRIISTALFAFSPLMIYWSFRIYTDIPALCCMLFSIWLFLKYLNRKKTPLILGAGALASLAFLFRFPIILFAIVLGSYLLIKKMFKPIIYFALGAIVILIPWLLFNYIKYNNPIWDLLAQGGAVAEYTAMQPVKLMLINISGALGLIILGLLPFLWWLIFVKKKNRIFANKEYFWIILAMILIEIIFYALIVRLKLSRYILTISPLIILLSIAGIYWLSINFIKYKKIILISVIILFCLQTIILAYSNIQTVHEQDFCRRPLYNAAEFLMLNYPEGSTVISNSWPWFGYYGNYKVSSTWSPDVDFLISDLNPDVIVLTNWGLEVNREDFINHSKTDELAVFRNNCGDEVIVLDIV